MNKNQIFQYRITSDEKSFDHAQFVNPVNNGDTVYWDKDDRTGSCGGVVLKVEHHPTLSIIFVKPI